jgi:ribosomal protein S18 acetylase RimI-like enzyme
MELIKGAILKWSCYFEIMAEILVRVCTEKDIELLVFLGRKTFTDTFADVNTEENLRLYLDSSYNSQKLKEEFREQGTVFFLAEIERLPVGFAKVRDGEKFNELKAYSTLEIERLYAVKDHLGSGVGKKLMETCIDHAKKKGCDLVWLGVWEKNPRAIRFYEKFGFEKFGSHVFHVGNDPQTDILMKKNI